MVFTSFVRLLIEQDISKLYLFSHLLNFAHNVMFLIFFRSPVCLIDYVVQVSDFRDVIFANPRETRHFPGSGHQLGGETVPSCLVSRLENTSIDAASSDKTALHTNVPPGKLGRGGGGDWQGKDFVTSHSRPLSNDSACHKLWQVYPPILQLKSRSRE